MIQNKFLKTVSFCNILILRQNQQIEDQNQEEVLEICMQYMFRYRQA